jgi:glutathione S-transferase
MRPDGNETVLFESNVICEYIEETQAGARLHPDSPLDRAEHRAWMEFGSAILGDIWGLETAQTAELLEQKRSALGAKFARVEAVLATGPWFAGERFGLVDAVFAPIFRYFDLFDRLADLGLWTTTPKLNAWRARLGARAKRNGGPWVGLSRSSSAVSCSPRRLFA